MQLQTYKDGEFEAMHDHTNQYFTASMVPFLVLPASMRPKWAPSPYAIFQAMKGRHTLPPAGPAARRGRALEGAIRFCFEEKGLTGVVKLRHYLRHPKNPKWIGSPDFLVGETMAETKAPVNRAPWMKGPPPHVVLQCQWHMACDPDEDREIAASLFVDQWGLDMPTWTIARNNRQIMAMEVAVERFQERLEKDTPPMPDSSESSYDAGRKLGDFEVGKVVNLANDENLSDVVRERAMQELIAWEEAELSAAAAKKRAEKAKFFFTARAVQAGASAVKTAIGTVIFSRTKAGSLTAKRQMSTEGIIEE